MKEIVIISGKGGTGKTSITASFAALAENAVLADCDVDAADLHLIMDPEITENNVFISGNEAKINHEKCTACGKCYAMCRFEAIKRNEQKTFYEVDPVSCEGCGVCYNFCPEKAVEFSERECGHWFSSKTRFGSMIHAKLGVGAENSGKLVSRVRSAAKEVAEKSDADLILIDGPPGTGCPVIASVTGASAVCIIPEPTLSGEHDMERVLKLVKHFRIPAFICINKWDINPEISQRIIENSVKSGAEIIGKIPYDTSITKSQLLGKSLIEYAPGSETALLLKSIWNNLLDKLNKN